MMILRESFTVFENFINPKDKEIALNKYKDADFNTIRTDALNGNEEAINYLFINSIGTISATFLKYYMKGKPLTKDSMLEWATIAYTKLAGLEGTNPLEKFNPETFDSQDKDFLLNKFKYYFYQYLSTYTKNKDKKNKRHDNALSIDTPLNKEDNTTLKDTLSKNYDKESDLDDNLLLDRFKDYIATILKSKAITRNNIISFLNYRERGFSFKEIAKAMKVSYQNIMLIKDKTKALWDKFFEVNKELV